MNVDCTDVRAALGVYVVGAIDPAERARVDAHLAGCPACRDELAGLAGLPALLGRVDEEQLVRVAGPPPELLEGLLARAAERQRGPLGALRRRWRWAPAAAAACLTLAVGGLAGGLVTAAGTESGRVTAPPTTSAPARSATAERIAAANSETGVRGYVLLHERKWGTEVEVHLSGLEQGARCRLQVIARDGRRDALGSWSVPYDEGYGEYRGSTMFPRGELSSFEIVGLDGEVVLTIPT